MTFVQKILIGVGVTVGILFCGALVFFAAQISATYPPLKEYKVDLSIAQVQERIHILSSDSSFALLHEDTVGDVEIGFRYYVTMHFSKDNSEYRFDFNYEIAHKFGQTRPFVNIRLIGSQISLERIGGYRATDTGIEQCIMVFENAIITKLDPNMIVH